MSLKPTHLAQAVEVMETGNFADAKEAVKAVIATVDALRAKDMTYAVVRQYPMRDGTAVYMAYGPFPTRAAGVKAAEHGRVGLAGVGALAVVPVRSPQAVDAVFKSLDELPDHVGPHHWSRIKEKIA